MSIGTVFVNNRTQAVRLPLDVRLPEGVHKVDSRQRARAHHRASRSILGQLLSGRPACE